MRTAWALLGAALTAGCSGQADPQPDPGATPAGTAPSTIDASPTVHAGSTRAATAGSGLIGQVSALDSEVSGLNMRVTDYGTVIDLPADALFEFDCADLTPAATVQLTKSAQMIRAAPAGAIRIVGHTDSKGDDAYNQRLSEARARAVADWFGQQAGVRRREFQVIGKGETEPVAPDRRPDGADDPTGRSRNRRVELILPNA